MSDKSGLIIFDLDDTLIDTSDVYWQAKESFIDVLYTKNISRQLIGDLFEKADTKNMSLLGFDPGRYLQSMNETYDFLINNYNVENSTSTREKIKESGNRINNNMPNPIDGAKELLEWASTKFTLALLTRGIEELQLKKIKHTQFEKYFTTLSIVANKDHTTFKKVVNQLNFETENTWLIGDSIKSDINPGIQAGIKCIFYRYKHHTYTWTQEYGDKPLGKFHTITNLLAAKEILSK
jgi:putative hydrolase of the HAD superfamily